MIRMAWAQSAHRPVSSALCVLAAAVLGLLAERTALFALACALYLAAALAAGTRPAELAALACLGWPERSLLALVLTESALAAVAAGVVAAVLAPVAGPYVAARSGAPAGGTAAMAAAVAVLLALAAGATRAVRARGRARDRHRIVASGASGREPW